MKKFNMLEDGNGGERIVPIIAAGGQDGRSNVALAACETPACLEMPARPPACPRSRPPAGASARASALTPPSPAAPARPPCSGLSARAPALPPQDAASRPN